MTFKTRKKVEVGTRFWLSNFGAFMLIVGFVFLLVFIFILSTGKNLPLEIKIIYYFEVMHDNVYRGFWISLFVMLLGAFMAERRIWSKTDLRIEGDSLEFQKKDKIISIPRQRILKLVLLKSYFTSDNKVRIRTNGLKKYILRMDDDVYNTLVDIYSDRFYED